MKKILAISAILIVAIVAFSACTSTTKSEELADKCLRIHIRANSNSDIDQTVKLKVRDSLTKYFEATLKDCKSKKEANDKLSESIPEIEKIANNTLEKNGFSYKASAKIRNEKFPDKQYGEYVFPAGYYDALIVNLGTGNGHNWWCVAFPPLCFVPAGGQEKVVYKSWVKELLDKIFEK